MRIVKLTPHSNFILLVEFDDGRTGSFDLKPYLDLEVFQPLKDVAEFNQVRNCGYYIEWPCGADLSAETVEAHLNRTKIAAG